LRKRVAPPREILHVTTDDDDLGLHSPQIGVRWRG
jgi:hypothetical protein